METRDLTVAVTNPDAPGPPPGGRPRRERRRASLDRLAPWLRALLIVGVVGLLELVVGLGLINPLFVPKPSDALAELVGDAGEYARLLGTTLYETAVAFLGAAVIGSGLGYLLWRHRVLAAAVEPVLVGLFASPIILLYPIFLIVLDRSVTAVIVQAMIGGIIPTVVTTQRALHGVRATYLRAGYLYCRNRRQSFVNVLLPAAMPGIVSGLRLGLTYTLLTVLATEYLTNIGGIGAEISGAYTLLRTDRMYAALILVLVLTSAFLYGLDRLERAFHAKGGQG
ncbi:ABC transporter permease subunit [Pseudonocardia sp.]|uniref:ABC transporter permease n=1 Tax=Pseudonocardia sp. TaxID=60912 RepID=UPI00260B730E|nr:ABC transporter permease subunit [Pseudonocardia sp.]